MDWLTPEIGRLLLRGLAYTIALTVITSQSFLVRKGAYSSIDELLGQTVAANAGSSVIPSWQAYAAERGAPTPEIVEFDDKLAAMQALRDGAVAGYSEDNITLLSLAAGDPNLELLPGGHNPVQFGIGVPNDDSAPPRSGG